MKLSIITICKNESSSIAQTLDSVAHQSFDDFEHLIFDGGSTDGTQKILESHIHPRMKIYSESDTGIYDGMNKGIKASCGEYLLFLNGGDFLAADDVLKMVASGFDGTQIIGCDIDHIGSGRKNSPSKLSMKFLIKDSPNHPATFIHRSCFDKLGPYDLLFRIAGDYDFFLRCKKADFSYKRMNILLTRFQSGGISDNPANFETIHQERKNSFIKNFGLFKWTALKVLDKWKL